MNQPMARSMVCIAVMLAVTVVASPQVGTKMIGYVSTAGQVELRGLKISGNGTLFSGDRVRVGEKGYAKVDVLGSGTKVELFENADVNIHQEGKEIRIAMNGGTVGFTAKSSVRLDVASFEVIASDKASVKVEINSLAVAGIRALSGNVTVRNAKTSELYRIAKGQARVLDLNIGTSNPVQATSSLRN